MILNRLEFIAMNNPLRAAIQRWVEGPRLRKMGGAIPGGRALEIGCGRGVGVEIILDEFGASRVDAIDLDPRMVRRAARRLKDRPATVSIGDATRLDAGTGTYDAVFDFGIIHHVPDWRKSLGEVFRVLKPGGRFFAEEMLHDFITSPLWRRLVDHPQHDRFDHEGFKTGVEQAGLRVVAARQIWNRMGWYVAEKPTRTGYF
jgi:ubiquinone/menaquinone biosynthesis C-methylase UbiE